MKGHWRVTFAFQPLTNGFLFRSLGELRRWTSEHVAPLGSEDGAEGIFCTGEPNVHPKVEPFACEVLRNVGLDVV